MKTTSEIKEWSIKEWMITKTGGIKETIIKEWI